MPRLINALSATVLLVAAIMLCSCTKPPATASLVTICGPTMGTQYTIKTVGLPDGVTDVSLQSDIDALLRRINQQMSTYLDNSEVSRFNRAIAGEWFEVSRETAMVLHSAQHHSERTGGAFDATLGPLVDLWHFGPQHAQRSLPNDHQIAAVQSRVGFEKLQVRMEPPGLTKSVDGLQIDLSAIAKGYAVDAVAELLTTRGIHAYMVEIGGELRVKGSRPGGDGWRIGIESPRMDKREILRVVQLDNVAMATSGDYRNYFEVDGKRYSHTINPRTGRPVEHQLASVTVLAHDCMTADALATALMVMGPETGLTFANENSVAALLISRTERGFAQQASQEFAALSGSP